MRLCSICFITLNPSERCNIFHDCDKWDGLSGYNLWQYQLYCVELCKLCRLYMVYLENWRLSSVHSNNRINSGVQTVVQVRELQITTVLYLGTVQWKCDRGVPDPGGSTFFPRSLGGVYAFFPGGNRNLVPPVTFPLNGP